MQNVGVFVTQYNSSLSSFVPNFRILSQVVAEKSLTEKKVFRQTKTSNWGIKMLALQARVKQFNPHLNM